MKQIKNFLKRETVLCVAVILAIVSMFMVLPDREYADYIDFRTLAILFCLMCVMAGFEKIGIFKWVAERLLLKVKDMRMLSIILVMLCFIFAMFITNDVALITFVPFTYTVLSLISKECMFRKSVAIIVLQTIAANMGSMMTPIGNPQNLYLYGKSGVSLPTFIMWMLPYTLISLVFVIICCLISGKGSSERISISFEEKTKVKDKWIQCLVYAGLFIVCLLTVAKIIPNYLIMLAIVLMVIIIMDKRILIKVDYSLLFTFAGFFIFIGNMGRIPSIRQFLEDMVTGNEVITSVISSQFISNVPAALLLSEFTTNYEALTVGINIGGLGTLIASMASLISFKQVINKAPTTKKKYLMEFTFTCFLLLSIMLVSVYVLM